MTGGEVGVNETPKFIANTALEEDYLSGSSIEISKQVDGIPLKQDFGPLSKKLNNQ